MRIDCNDALARFANREQHRLAHAQRLCVLVILRPYEKQCDYRCLPGRSYLAHLDDDVEDGVARQPRSATFRRRTYNAYVSVGKHERQRVAACSAVDFVVCTVRGKVVGVRPLSATSITLMCLEWQLVAQAVSCHSPSRMSARLEPTFQCPLCPYRAISAMLLGRHTAALERRGGHGRTLEEARVACVRPAAESCHSQGGWGLPSVAASSSASRGGSCGFSDASPREMARRPIVIAALARAATTTRLQNSEFTPSATGLGWDLSAAGSVSSHSALSSIVGAHSAHAAGGSQHDAGGEDVTMGGEVLPCDGDDEGDSDDESITSDLRALESPTTDVGNGKSATISTLPLTSGKPKQTKTAVTATSASDVAASTAASKGKAAATAAALSQATPKLKKKMSAPAAAKQAEFRGRVLPPAPPRAPASQQSAASVPAHVAAADDASSEQRTAKKQRVVLSTDQKHLVDAASAFVPLVRREVLREGLPAHAAHVTEPHHMSSNFAVSVRRCQRNVAQAKFQSWFGRHNGSACVHAGTATGLAAHTA